MHKALDTISNTTIFTYIESIDVYMDREKT